MIIQDYSGHRTDHNQGFVLAELHRRVIARESGRLSNPAMLRSMAFPLSLE